MRAREREGGERERKRHIMLKQREPAQRKAFKLFLQRIMKLASYNINMNNGTRLLAKEKKCAHKKQNLKGWMVKSGVRSHIHTQPYNAHLKTQVCQCYGNGRNSRQWDFQPKDKDRETKRHEINGKNEKHRRTVDGNKNHL